ncbi:hypothetical protein [Marinactinospora rubrisoli]|uniref:Uncharacterized protein n=1 Tax=Marinactinospora rubrisoli TaxID=2715399 RepID=A0ABW2KJU2_9ACTN
MSRTDKTKPLWVRYMEHGPRPVHDHRFGPCDLPPSPAREDSGTRCRWEPAMLLAAPTCCAECGVRCCSRERQVYAKIHNRRDRYAARRAARRFVTGLDER